MRFISQHRPESLGNQSTMADDKEVLREIWEGRLPVCFSLATEEVSTPIAPDPFYLMIPRMTFFPLVTEKVKSIQGC